MIQPRNETKNLLLQITKNCRTFIEQTHTEQHETLEFKLTKPKEIFFQSTILISRMLDDRINRFRKI